MSWPAIVFEPVIYHPLSSVLYRHACLTIARRTATRHACIAQSPGSSCVDLPARRHMMDSGFALGGLVSPSLFTTGRASRCLRRLLCVKQNEASRPSLRTGRVEERNKQDNMRHEIQYSRGQSYDTNSIFELSSSMVIIDMKRIISSNKIIFKNDSELCKRNGTKPNYINVLTVEIEIEMRDTFEISANALARRNKLETTVFS